MKIGLTADWHICSRHLTVSRRGPDFFKAAMQVVDKAHDAGIRYLLNGGDTFHDSRLLSEHVQDLLRIDERLQQLGMTMLTIDGDHDRADPSWMSTLLPERRATEAGIVSINQRTVSLSSRVRVRGIPPCDAETFVEQLLALVAHGQETSEATCPNIIVWHGPIRELCGYPDPLAVSIEDIPTEHFDAILCGDIHKRGFVVKDGCLIGYPGSTELRGRDETVHQRSFTVIDTAARPFTEQAHPIQSRPAYAFQIKDEGQLDEVVGKLKALPKDPWPMVFVRYDRDVPNVKSRLYNALDNPDAILRAAAAPGMHGLDLWKPVIVDHRRQLVDFVPKFFPTPGALRDLAVKCCDKNADHRQLIDAYCDARLESIGEQVKSTGGV